VGGSKRVTSILGNYYRDIGKRKVFFERFAKRNGFDPLIADNWYSVQISTICAQKVFVYFMLYLFYCDLLGTYIHTLQFFVAPNREKSKQFGPCER
jgi:hypothetical protein